MTCGVLMDNDIYHIISNFRISSPVSSVKLIEAGHIHSTYIVKCIHDAFILQQINHHVFRDVKGLMENIVRLCDHMEKKIKQSLPEWIPMKLIMTRNNESCFLFREQYWRMFNYIPHEPLKEGHPSLSKVFEAGSAYGKFVYMLSDLPGKPLNETIPRFHDMDYRHDNFLKSIKSGNPDRLKIASAEVDAAIDGISKTEKLQKLIREKTLPQRIAHHDAKMSNVLLNQEGKAISVIDLDTVMTGILHSDFGDSIRTFANTADEDEQDTRRIHFNIPAFENYTKGYMKAVSSFISKSEVETLYLAPYFITCQQAVRFLTDYLENDTYYHISYPDQNLIRTRAQLTLMNRMWEVHPLMEKIISS